MDNLPRQATPFIGRETALQALGTLLAQPDVPLITIHGPGGIGKTRLALRAARKQRGNFRDGVFFTRLGSHNDPESIVPAIAAATGFYFYKGPEDQVTQLINFLKDKSLLIVIDHFEQDFVGAEIIAELLAAAPKVRVLTTSRHPLDLPCETVFTLPGMTCPDPDAPLPDPHSEAIQLFIDCAQRARQGFRLHPQDLEHLAQICKMLAGNPLGIVLVAPWAGSRALRQIVQALQNQIKNHPGGAGQIPEQHANLQAAFNFSRGLLTNSQQTTLANLSVFKGGFTYQAAQEIAGATLDELRELENKSLLHYNFAAGRYEIHNLIWQFAFESLSEDPLTYHKVHTAHSAWYIAALENWFIEFQGARQMTTLQLIEADLENVRAAWDWAISQGHTLRLGRALNGLCFYYHWRGLYQEGETLCFLTAHQLSLDLPATNLPPTNVTPPNLHPADLPKAGSPTAGTPPHPSFKLLARVLAWRSVFSHAIGHPQRAEQYLEESLRYNDKANQDGFYLRQVGDCLAALQLPGPEPYYQQSLAVCRDAGDRWGEASTLAALGWSAYHQGEYKTAHQLYLDSLAIQRKLRDQIGIANTLHGLGSVAMRQGQFREAEGHLQECCQMVKETGNQVEIAQKLNRYGWVLVLNGKFKEGCASIAECIDRWDHLGHGKHKARLCTTLGLAELHLGKMTNAQRTTKQALDFAVQNGTPGEVAFAQWGLGWVRLAQDELAQAWELLSDSERIWQELGAEEESGYAHALLGTLACEQGQWDPARHYLVQTLGTTIRLHTLLPLLYAFPALGMWFDLQGKPGLKAQIHDLAASYPLVTASHYFKAVTQRACARRGIPPIQLKTGKSQDARSNGHFLETASKLLEALV